MAKAIYIKIEKCGDCPYFEYNGKTPFLSDEFDCSCDGPYLGPDFDYMNTIHPDCPLEDEKEM